MYHFKAFGYSVGVVIHGPAVLLKKKNTNDSHILFQFILPELLALASGAFVSPQNVGLRLTFPLSASPLITGA